jgi:putative transposase
MKCIMRVMGLESVVPKPDTSKPHPEHPVFPYLLRNLSICRPDHVWAADITYIPMAHGFAYLVTVIDWYSRRVLAWRLSNTMESSFCLEALREALEQFPKPEIFNTDQGSQFTSEAFTGALRSAGITISMDGKGRCIDNVFVDRVWRSLKYEEVSLHAYDDLDEARAGIGRYFEGGGEGAGTRGLNAPASLATSDRALVDPGVGELVGFGVELAADVSEHE